VPPGVYLTHTVFLRSGVNLHLQRGSVIRGDTKPGAFSGALIHAYRIENRPSRPGLINGQGHAKHFPSEGRATTNLLLFRLQNMHRPPTVTLWSTPPRGVFRIRRVRLG